MSNASRVGPSAAVNSPFARAFTALLTSRSVVSFAVGGGTWPGSISQQRHARRPLPQAHGVFECRFTAAIVTAPPPWFAQSSRHEPGFATHQASGQPLAPPCDGSFEPF